MKLRVSFQRARTLIEQIPHSTCVRAAARRWHVTDDENVRAQSVLWLFCWAKTGMGSPVAAEEARRVFDLILPVTFDQVNARVDHEYARRGRYSRACIEAELDALLNRILDMRLKVTTQHARTLIDQIPHSTCVRAAAQRWHVADDGTVRAQSVLWLFCWAKTGMGSPVAAEEARRVFDLILPVTFDQVNARVDHEYARRGRYSRACIEAELDALLNR
jgi:hypothetical protein